ncbi:unnamed protein product, partial [Polarella glacialis]
DNHSTSCVEGLPLTDQAGHLSASTCDAWTDHFERPVAFLKVLSYLHWSGKRLALAVEDPADIHKVETLRQTLTKDWYPDILMKNIPCVNIEKDLLGALT